MSMEDNAVKFGAQEDGSYISPYAATIYYSEASLFETLCATYYPRAQGVPMPVDAVLDRSAEAAEYVTETVILFGEKYTAPILQQFKERGFKNIIVLGAGEPDEGIQLVGPAAFLALMPFNGIQMFVAEYVMKSTFGSYVPVCGEVTADAGRALCTTINAHRTLDPKETYARQLAALAGFDGFELIEKYIQTGAGINMGRAICAQSLIDNGRTERTEFGSILHVQMSSLNAAVISAAKGVDYVALYKFFPWPDSGEPLRDVNIMEVILAAIDGKKISGAVMYEVAQVDMGNVQGPIWARLTREQAARLGFP
jgi:hypothetical protein